MADINPKVPDANYPPDVKTNVPCPNNLIPENMRKLEYIPMSSLVNLIVSALQILRNPNGSTIADIMGVLKSQNHTVSLTDVRAAVIVAMKEGKVKRPPSAVTRDVYGLYVVSEDSISPQQPAKRIKVNGKRSGAVPRHSAKVLND